MTTLPVPRHPTHRPRLRRPLDLAAALVGAAVGLYFLYWGWRIVRALFLPLNFQLTLHAVELAALLLLAVDLWFRHRSAGRSDVLLRLDDGSTVAASRTLVIGSSPGAQGVALQGPQVSRRHLEARTESGQTVVTDLGSTNGTFLNGEDLRHRGPRTLRPGDRLELGRGGPGLACVVDETEVRGLLSRNVRIVVWLVLLWSGLYLGWQANIERLNAEPWTVGNVSVDFTVFRSFLPFFCLGLVTSLAGLFWFFGTRRLVHSTRPAGTALQILLVLGIVLLYPLLPAVAQRYSQAAERAFADVGEERWLALEEWERSGGDPQEALKRLSAKEPGGDTDVKGLPDLGEKRAAIVSALRRYSQGRMALRWATNLGARKEDSTLEVTYFRQAYALVFAMAFCFTLPMWSPGIRRRVRDGLRRLTQPFSQGLVRAADHGSVWARMLRPVAYWDVFFGFLAAAVVAVTLWTPFGTTLGRGKSLYLDLPGMPTIQSVELVKAFFVLFMAGYFARHGKLLAKIPRQRYLVPYFLAALCTLALTGLQADMGGLFMLGLFLGLVFMAATGNWRLVLTVPLLLLPGAGLAFLLGLASVVKTRIDIWLAPRLHPLGEQIVQARQLFLSSGWTGFVPRRILAWQVPDVQADLVVAAFGERFGLVGLLVLIVVWYVLVASLLRAAGRAGGSASILLASIAALVLVQFLTQAGGTLGLLPLTGVPVPWLSHGLTASLVFTALVGLALTAAPSGKELDSTEGSSARRLRYLQSANRAVAITLGCLVLFWTVVLPRTEGVGKEGNGYRWKDVARAGTIAGWVEAGLFVPTPRGSRLQVDQDAYRAYVADHEDPGFLRLLEVADALRTTEDGIIPLPYAVTNPNPFADRSRPRGWLTGREGTALAMTDSRGRRRYPLGDAAFHPVGYAGALARSTGVEAAIDGFLSGRDLGWPLRFRSFVEDVHSGPDVVLTIDAGLQRSAYRELAGRRGAVVVMDLRDGALLALASSPAVEPEGQDLAGWRAAARQAEMPLLNRAIHSTNGYSPPGSVFKMVVAAAGLISHGGFDPRREVECLGSDAELHVSCAHGHAHGRVDLAKALTVSCNVYFARAMEILGADEVREMAARFGFNAEHPLNLLRGVPGATLWAGDSTVLDPEVVLRPHELVRVGFGQGPVSATPLEVARMGAVIATGGKLVDPYLVRAIGFGLFEDGIRRVVWEKPIRVAHRKRVIHEKVADWLQRPLQAVFEDPRGTARSLDKLWRSDEGYRLAAKSPGEGWERVPVAGKTGSAWRSDRDRTDDAWMVAWAPADEPRVVVSVLVEDSGEGGRVAGPVVMRMLRDAMMALDDES